MHYKNGRKAQQGDKIIAFSGNQPLCCGILHSVVAGSTSCNGRVVAITQNDPYVTIGDCLHVDDVVKATIPNSLPAEAPGSQVAESAPQ